MDTTRKLALATLALGMGALLASPAALTAAAAKKPVAKTPAKAAKPAAPAVVHVDLAAEKEGGEPSRFLAVVGDWSVVTDGGKKVLLVDGRQWKKGQPAGGLADKARSIYGSRHEEFIDNVKAFAYFPYAAAPAIDDFHDGEISLRFKLLGGALDQCAGILFNLKPNGDYLTVRFNGKEDNLVLWTFDKGKRSFVKKGTKDVPLALRDWHTMKIVVKGTALEGWLNGEKLLDYTLPAPVAGKVGVWSKTDSIAEFDDFTVTPAAKPGA
jgi:hypothetical protein